METSKIGVLNCRIDFKEKSSGESREVTWHPGTIVEVHDFNTAYGSYQEVQRIYYYETPKVKVYYNDTIKFRTVTKHKISLMWVEGIEWKNIVHESLGMKWIKER